MTLRIKELRINKGWTQKKLADMAKVPRSTLAEIERHCAFPKAQKLERIAKALGVTVDELYK